MRIKHLVVGGLAAVLLAGCGGSSTDGEAESAAPSSSDSGNGLADQTGPEVVDAAADALETAGSVRVMGSTTTAGQAGDIDLQLQGDDTAGTVTIGGDVIELVSLAGAAYIKAPASFWQSSGVPAEVLPQLDGVWVVLPPEAAAGFEDLSLAGFIDELRNPTGVVSDEVTTAEVEGTPVVEVTEDDGSVLRVAAEGEPYPLELESTGDEAGTVMFSGFGEQQTIEAPPNPLDLTTLGG
ncbi:hypothetical protein GB931_13740 [Modestobacter sp. I12A-02628]|uniref:Lipoprotein LprG n=1 Tax=Goekera deserti TaxID=2497753 RepID=A0A7K3WJZ0_9ACTN|nr:hypothetical protein [Goekera deserti]MPQ98965.1 hypothetical protein [Goekera deserti]NDI50569.1 hypothetical protein [Goekera deserti]NEL56642.1 hypothetical protein [Goekera deserti]